MKNILMILVGVMLLAGLFWWMKPAPRAAVPVAAATTPAATPEATAPVSVAVAPEPQRFDLVVKGKQLVSGPAVISVVQGTPVTLRLTVDHHDELHLHGYDLSLKLNADQTAELTFIADRSGRFEYELHHAHLDLGALEVQPQ